MRARSENSVRTGLFARQAAPDGGFAIVDGGGRDRAGVTGSCNGPPA
jgi:hypothetical protein